MRVVLVRHGQAEAGWGDAADPGLSELGRSQAEAVAESLAALGPCPLYSSPLRRTRETAAAFEARWGTPAIVEPRVGEIRSPSDDLAARSDWLAGVMRSRWDEVDQDLGPWRGDVVDALFDIAGAAPVSVVVTHFIAINVAVGWATGDSRVTCFLPDNCSSTVLDVHGGELQVVQLGGEAVTEVR